MAHYKSLKAWQHARRLAVECSRAALRFPAYEQQALAQRLRRASYSVPLSLADGGTRQGARQRREILEVAQSALAEVETIIHLARDLEYVSPADFGRLEALANETGKMLFGLLRRVCGEAEERPRRRYLHPS